MGALNELYARYRDRVEFLLVYIKEAHPADGWSAKVNPRLRYVQDPTRASERFQVANSCVNDLEIAFPCVIDDMDDRTMHAYNALPDRLYLVGRDGRIAFQGPRGPWGFRPALLERAIRTELGEAE